MKKLLTSLTFLVLPLCAQYTGLVTTRDGNQLYFSSQLRLRGTTEADSPKIFRYSVGFALIRQPATSGEILVEPEASADGKVIGYTAEFPQSCVCGYCFGNQPPETGRIEGKQIPHNPLADLAGRLRLARDGRYAMICCEDIGPRSEPRLIDLRSGEVTDLKGFDAIGDGRQAFGNLPNGSRVVLLSDATGPFLLERGKVTRLHFSHVPILARMSADARRVVYEAADKGGRYELVVHEIGTGEEHVLQEGPAVPAGLSSNVPAYFQPWIGDDGSAVLFFTVNPLSGVQQLDYEFTNGSGERVLTAPADVPEGVASATLSGDAATVYAGTPMGRMLRVSVPSGKIDELAGPTPQLYQLQNSAPGSVNWIAGAALRSGAALPKVQVGDFEAPVVSAEPSLVKFQIPWEVRPGQQMEVRVQDGATAPFESVLTFTSSAISAQFLNPLAGPFGSGVVPAGLANHEDFRSYVTPSNPALPGETIHYYLAGLGPVAPAIGTGQKTPGSGPLHRAIHPPVFCSVANDTAWGATATVRFVGLAPTYLGLYQMDVEVPHGLVNADSALSCGFPDLEQGGYSVLATDLYVRVQ